MSTLEFDSIIPVNPPKVNKKIKPLAHNIETDFLEEPKILEIHLKIFTPVGIAIVIVAAVK
jgi:hypothetical protein